MRLIDADVVIKHIDEYWDMAKRTSKTSKGEATVKQTIKMIVNSLRPVDAVPVIRCKDCKYAKKIYTKNLPWLKQWEYSCGYFNTHSVMGDGFCSMAERKDNG